MKTPTADRLAAMNWALDDRLIDWEELSQLYRIAPLGEKPPAGLKLAFSNSMFKCFVFEGARLVGAGRAVADGRDCSYLYATSPFTPIVRALALARRSS